MAPAGFWHCKCTNDFCRRTGSRILPQNRSFSKTNYVKTPAKPGGLWRRIFLTLCLLSAVAAGCFVFSVWGYLRYLPDMNLVERYEPIEAIALFDRNDHLFCTVEGDQDRRVVPISQISAQMQQAMLAAEDHHFFEHHGINFASVMRAFMVNIQAGHVVEGGSTITQQLVKNLFFTDAQRTMDRKVKEAFLAWQIESRYSKEQILEMYLNQVYFGSNAYGIERAAARYFDKKAAQLDLAQSAFLAGLVKAPSELGTVANRSEAISRQQEILDKMVEYGYITPLQEKKAAEEKLLFRRGANQMQKYPYYVSTVLELLRSRFSQEEMRKQGLRVYTNLDPQAQDAAEAVLNESIKTAPKGVTQGALVSVLVQDGSVVALVGGVGNFWQHQFNRATNPHTAGSSFKPFVYLTAFLKGTLNPNSLIEDTPLTIHQGWNLPNYAPKNFDHKFMGRIPVRKALALSRNVCSVRVAQLVGVDDIVETARLAGITTKLEKNLSLALGSSAVTPEEMAGAYATFARMGVAIKPQLVRRIENNRGQVIEVFEPKVDKVFPVEPVARLVDVLQDVVKYGTGTQARLADRPVAGKTGTADAAKDIWFVGFTPHLCTAIWAGNDEDLPIPGQNVTGGGVMAKIWREYNKRYYDMHPTPAGSFVAPSALTKEEEEKEQKDLNNAASGTASNAAGDENAPHIALPTGVVITRENNNAQSPIAPQAVPQVMPPSAVPQILSPAAAPPAVPNELRSLLPQSQELARKTGEIKNTPAPAGFPPLAPSFNSSLPAPAPDLHGEIKPAKPANLTAGPTIMMSMPSPAPAVGVTPSSAADAQKTPYASTKRLYPAVETSKFRPVTQSGASP